MAKLDGLYSSKTVEWETPQDLFDRLNDEFHFTLDPCCTDENAKCKKHYTKEQDGLSQDWTGEIVYCNPPYGREMPKWIRKCYEHYIQGGTAVMLIPARTDTKAFHDYIYGKAEVRFLRGRLKFGGSKNSAPFPSLVAVYRPEKRCENCEYRYNQNFRCGHCSRNKYLISDNYEPKITVT